MPKRAMQSAILFTLAVIFLSLTTPCSYAKDHNKEDRQAKWERMKADKRAKDEAEDKKRRALFAAKENAEEEKRLKGMEGELATKIREFNKKFKEELSSLKKDQEALVKKEREAKLEIAKEERAIKDAEYELQKRAARLQETKDKNARILQDEQRQLERKNMELARDRQINEDAFKREEEFLKKKRLNMEEAASILTARKTEKVIQARVKRAIPKYQRARIDSAARQDNRSQTQEGIVKARALIAEADMLYNRGMYDEAAEKYKEARKGLR
ncbi:MAG: hypothetical protein V3S04_01255 [Candidatus Omnitrophota bacterium]